MKVNKKAVAGVLSLVAIVAVLLLGVNSLVYVPEDEYICIKQFSKVTEVYEEAGLHFKNPFVETAESVPKNAMVYNLNPSDVLTLDKKAMTVSSYTVWKITDPLLFLQTAVTKQEAERRLDATIYNGVKNLLSSMNQADTISTRGTSLNEQITSSVRDLMTYYGIEIVDIQIKQFDLPQDNKEAVYTRMISERAQIAAQYLAEGKEEAEIIRNTADKGKTLLISEAEALAAQYKAEGESQYMRTLAEAYSGPERAEFYEFIRSMDALKAVMKGDKTLVLPINSPLTKWFIER